MSERTDQDPFIAPLSHVSLGSVAEFQAFANNDRFIVRLAPEITPADYTNFERTLSLFEESSGLSVVPHYNLYIRTRHHENSVIDLLEDEEDGFYPTLVHVTERVYGEDFADKSETPNENMPPEVVEKMLSGITTSVIDAYDNYKPYSCEIRPSQFRYGHTTNDPEDKIYMIDIDWSNLAGLSTDDAVELLGYIVDYLEKYPPNQIFRTVGQEIMTFLQRPDCKQLGWGHQEMVGEKIASYLDALDHDDI